MNQFTIVPLSKEFAEKIRNTRKDDFGHDVLESIATGRGPCRVALKPFIPGQDKRFLLSHSPFDIDNAFSQPGPVFISSEAVEPYADVHRFPPAIKANKKSFPLSLIGYTSDQQMVFSQRVEDRDVDEMIVEIFNNHPGVAYLHARSAEACCYICRINRG